MIIYAIFTSRKFTDAQSVNVRIRCDKGWGHTFQMALESMKLAFFLFVLFSIQLLFLFGFLIFLFIFVPLLNATCEIWVSLQRFKCIFFSSLQHRVHYWIDWVQHWSRSSSYIPIMRSDCTKWEFLIIVILKYKW